MLRPDPRSCASDASRPPPRGVARTGTRRGPSPPRRPPRRPRRYRPARNGRTQGVGGQKLLPRHHFWIYARPRRTVEGHRRPHQGGDQIHRPKRLGSQTHGEGTRGGPHVRPHDQAAVGADGHWPTPWPRTPPPPRSRCPGPGPVRTNTYHLPAMASPSHRCCTSRWPATSDQNLYSPVLSALCSGRRLIPSSVGGTVTAPARRPRSGRVVGQRAASPRQQPRPIGRR